MPVGPLVFRSTAYSQGGGKEFVVHVYPQNPLLWSIIRLPIWKFWNFCEKKTPNRPNYFFDFPIIGPKKKVVVNFIYGYQTLSGEKCKSNGKRIRSIRHTSEEENPKNHPKIPYFMSTDQDPRGPTSEVDSTYWNTSKICKTFNTMREAPLLRKRQRSRDGKGLNLGLSSSSPRPQVLLASCLKRVRFMFIFMVRVIRVVGIRGSL